MRRVLPAALLLLAIAGCRSKGPASSFTNLGASDQSVRDAFNADVGKVRLVILVAPT